VKYRIEADGIEVRHAATGLDARQAANRYAHENPDVVSVVAYEAREFFYTSTPAPGDCQGGCGRPINGGEAAICLECQA
jgi:hypothetical protein